MPITLSTILSAITGTANPKPATDKPGEEKSKTGQRTEQTQETQKQRDAAAQSAEDRAAIARFTNFGRQAGAGIGGALLGPPGAALGGALGAGAGAAAATGKGLFDSLKGGGGGSSGGGSSGGGSGSSGTTSGCSTCGGGQAASAGWTANTVALDPSKIAGYDPSKDSGNRLKSLSSPLGSEKAYSNVIEESKKEGNDKKVYSVTFTREDGGCSACNDLKSAMQGSKGIPAHFDKEAVEMYKVTAATGQNLANSLGVTGWPTTIIIQNGKELARVEGNNPTAIETNIAKALPEKEIIKPETAPESSPASKPAELEPMDLRTSLLPSDETEGPSQSQAAPAD